MGKNEPADLRVGPSVVPRGRLNLVLHLLWECCNVAPVPQATQNRLKALAAPDDRVRVELEVRQSTRRDHGLINTPVGDAKERSMWQRFEVMMHFDCHKERAQAA